MEMRIVVANFATTATDGKTYQVNYMQSMWLFPLWKQPLSMVRYSALPDDFSDVE